jgi:hypothetical protein
MGIGAIFLMVGLWLLRASNLYEKYRSTQLTYANTVVKFDANMLKRMTKNE